MDSIYDILIIGLHQSGINTMSCITSLKACISRLVKYGK